MTLMAYRKKCELINYIKCPKVSNLYIFSLSPKIMISETELARTNNFYCGCDKTIQPNLYNGPKRNLSKIILRKIMFEVLKLQ